MTLRPYPRIFCVCLGLVFISACSNSDSEGTDFVQDPAGMEASELPDNSGGETTINNDSVPASETDAVTNPSNSEGSANSDTVPAQQGELSVLNRDNASGVIFQAFEVISGRAYDRRLSAYPYVKRAPRLEPAVNALAQHLYYETLECNNDGSKTDNVYNQGTGFSEFIFYDTMYVGCNIGGDVINGRSILSGDACCAQGYQKEFTDNYSVSFGNSGRMTVSGTYKRFGYVSVENLNYNITYSGGSLSVSNATTTREPGVLSGSFTMAPPITNNQPVAVVIENRFENNEAPNDYGVFHSLAYATGLMRITSDDSMIVVDANNGDPDTVNITLTSGGDSVSWEAPWSNWFAALAYIPPVIGGDSNPMSADGDGSLLTANTYRDILTEVFAVMQGQRFGREVVNFPNYPYPEFPYDEMRNLDGYGEERSLICDNSGTAVSRPFRWGARQETSGWRTEFSNCTKDGTTYQGNFEERYYGTKINFSSGLTASHNAGTNTFKGSVMYKHRANRGEGQPYSLYQLNNVHFDSTANGNEFLLSDALFNYTFESNYRKPDVDKVTRFSGRLSLASDVTNQQTLQVTIPEEILIEHPEYADNRTLNSQSDFGTLHINAGNGNELFLTAKTGEPGTFRLDIYQPGQAPVQIIERWQDWTSNFGFDFDLID